MAEAEYSVAIADEMRALWRASRRGGRAPGTRAERPAPARRSVNPAIDAAPAPKRRAAEAPLERIVLRRDGMRPLVFLGVTLLSFRRVDEPGAAEFALGLYLAADGQAVVSIALRPTDGTQVQELHAAEAVDTAGDLGRLLDRFDPGLALPCPLGLPEERAADITDRARRLAEGYARFREALRGAGATNPLWRTM